MMNKQDETPSGERNRKRREALTIDDLRDPQRPTCSVVQAAHLLGISKGSAYSMIKDGRLPSIEITPRRWRVSGAGLLAMLGIDR
jgi:excisionase family DNA binding protein